MLQPLLLKFLMKHLLALHVEDFTRCRLLCVRPSQGELKQLRSVADLQQCINPRNEAAALALLVANQQGTLLAVQPVL
jgi:hypothetical protein